LFGVHQYLPDFSQLQYLSTLRRYQIAEWFSFVRRHFSFVLPKTLCSVNCNWVFRTTFFEFLLTLNVLNHLLSEHVANAGAYLVVLYCVINWFCTELHALFKKCVQCCVFARCFKKLVHTFL